MHLKIQQNKRPFTKFTNAYLGSVPQCTGLSNIMFENNFTIQPLNINFNRPWFFKSCHEIKILQSECEPARVKHLNMKFMSYLKQKRDVPDQK